MEKGIIESARVLSKDFLKFLNAGVSPYHVVKESSSRLLEKGFVELKENESWKGKINANSKYFLSRGGSSLVAFTTPSALDASQTYFKIVGTHTDSPCIRLAPFSKFLSQEYHLGYIQTYGGGLWHTWLDRDLIVAGRVLVRAKNGDLQHKLYRSPSSFAKICDLCIHLRKDRASVTISPETHLRAFFATETFDKSSELKLGHEEAEHYRGLWEDIATQLQCSVKDIVDFDLCFADSQPAEVIGVHGEFISGARLDNLFSAWSSIFAFTSAKHETDVNAINIAGLFDHEEIGSNSITGANSELLPGVVARIFEALYPASTENDRIAAHQRSFFISADMAHAVHPAYMELHQDGHRIKMNKGVVLKINCNQRYSTSGISGALIKEIGNGSGVPVQQMAVNQNGGCGSTIGPMLSSLLGMKSADIGIAQLGMHSIRETCGVLDSYHYTRFMEHFYQTPLAKITYE